MPVGKHRPRSSPRGDYSAECSICGVLYYRSKLVLKADGNLYCPDDVRGLDSVTLSEGNARDAAYAFRERLTRGTGAQDNSGVPTSLMPSGILSSGEAGARQYTDMTGWWGPRDLREQSGVSNMDNILRPSAKSRNQGNLLQVEASDRPAYNGTDTITFDGSGFLRSSNYLVVGQSEPAVSVWCVGSIDDPENTETDFGDFLWHLTDVGGFATYFLSSEGNLPTHGMHLRTYSGDLIGTWDNNVGTPVTTTVSYPFTSTGLHLFELRVTATELLLFVDNVQVAATTLASTAAASYRLDYTVFGAGSTGASIGGSITNEGMTGVMNELVVYPGAVTTQQATGMATYFSRNYSGLSIS